LIRIFEYIFLRNKIYNIDWFNTTAKLIPAWKIDNKHIPKADIVVATAWPTAYSGFKLNKNKGEKFYFIQHYEIWSGEKEMIDDSYRLPLKKIVIASWLKNLIINKFNEDVYGLIINGVNIKQFYNDNKVFNKIPVIGLIWSNLEWKGFQDGLDAYKMVKNKYNNIKLVIFGKYTESIGKNRRPSNIPQNVTFINNPPQEEIRKIYSKCDIFVSPSHKEGCQLPPMEAMACKCALVATNVGGVPDYTLPNKTAIVVPPRKPEQLAEGIKKLIENRELLKKISFNGYNYINNFTWEKSTDKLENLLKKSLIN